MIQIEIFIVFATSEASSDTISTILGQHARQLTVRALCRPIKNANGKCYIKVENVIEVESVGKVELHMIKVCNVKVENVVKIEKAIKV